MPDLHPGKGIPIGAAVITEGLLYPELVDYDIGCGMSFLKTGIQVSKLSQKKLDQLATSLTSIDCPWDSNPEAYQAFLSKKLKWGDSTVDPIDIELLSKKHLQVLGTIGGGNHFAEFQEIDRKSVV